MMLIIQNLPWMMNINDVKRLVKNECGITDAIVDNLKPSGKVKSVTIGLVDDEDGLQLFRKLNGYQLQGHHLLVENMKKSTPNPPRLLEREYNQSSFDQSTDNHYNTSQRLVSYPIHQSSAISSLMTLQSVGTHDSVNKSSNLPYYQQSQDNFKRNTDSWTRDSEGGYSNRDHARSSPYQVQSSSNRRDYSPVLAINYGSQSSNQRNYAANDQPRKSSAPSRSSKRRRKGHEAERFREQELKRCRKSESPVSLHNPWVEQASGLETILKNYNSQNLDIMNVSPVNPWGSQRFTEPGLSNTSKLSQINTLFPNNNQHMGYMAQEQQSQVMFGQPMSQFTNSNANYYSVGQGTQLSQYTQGAFKTNNQIQPIYSPDTNLGLQTNYPTQQINYPTQQMNYATLSNSQQGGQRNLKSDPVRSNNSYKDVSKSNNTYSTRPKETSPRRDSCYSVKTQKVDPWRDNFSFKPGHGGFTHQNHGPSNSQTFHKPTGQQRSRPRSPSKAQTFHKPIDQQRSRPRSPSKAQTFHKPTDHQRSRRQNRPDLPQSESKFRKDTLKFSSNFQTSGVNTNNLTNDRPNNKEKFQSATPAIVTSRIQRPFNIKKGVKLVVDEMTKTHSYSLQKLNVLRKVLKPRLHKVIDERTGINAHEIMLRYRELYPLHTDAAFLSTVDRELLENIKRKQSNEKEPKGAANLSSKTPAKSASNVQTQKVNANILTENKSLTYKQKLKMDPIFKAAVKSQNRAIHDTAVLIVEGMSKTFGDSICDSVTKDTTLKQLIKARLRSILGGKMETGVEVNDLLLRYREKFPAYSDVAFMSMVEDKVEERTKLAEEKETKASTKLRPSTSILPKYPEGDKMKFKENKRTALSELDSNTYTLDPPLSEALKEELSVINQMIAEGCDNPPPAIHELEHHKVIKEKCLGEIDKCLSLMVKKRLLDIRTNLALRILAPVKVPNIQRFVQFLKSIGLISIRKCTTSVRTFIGYCRNYDDYDRLCSMASAEIDGLRITIKPLNLYYKPPINTKQISQNVEDQPGPDDSVFDLEDGIDVPLSSEIEDNIEVEDNNEALVVKEEQQENDLKGCNKITNKDNNTANEVVNVKEENVNNCEVDDVHKDITNNCKQDDVAVIVKEEKIIEVDGNNSEVEKVNEDNGNDEARSNCDVENFDDDFITDLDIDDDDLEDY